MACVPLVVQAGTFDPVDWITAPSTTKPGDKTVTLTTSGPNPGLTVTAPGGSEFFAKGNDILRYMFVGSDNYLLVLKTIQGSPATHFVSLIDFSNVSAVQILTANSPNSSALPVVHASLGTGSAFLIYSESPVPDIQNLAIHRSDNGDVLCALGSSFVADGPTFGEATATHVVIHYHTGGMPKTKSCPLPSGDCKVTPASKVFQDAVLGGAPALATTTAQFEIKNVGDDCLVVQAIANAGPFSVTSTSKPVPADLEPAQKMTVEVTFAPNAIGTYGPSNLAITRTPAKGDGKLVCEGEARAPVVKIGFNSTALDFGMVALGEDKVKNLIVQNKGEKDLNVSVPAPGPGPFQWAAFSGVIAYQGTKTIPITFAPQVEAPAAKTISVTSDDSNSPHAIQLAGEGCVANAEIAVPPLAPIDFGQVQQGFRTVRYIVVDNVGDGQLTFTARIAGADAGLYGLQPASGSVTDVQPERDYAVDPVSPCGKTVSAGTGQTIVGVAFYADPGDTPRMTSAELIVEDHNATNTATPAWVYPLSAEMVEPVAIDAALVLDRSGSMGEASGDRIKTEAEVSAGRLFVQLARPDLDDRLALVKFNTTPGVFQSIVHVTGANQPSLVDKVSATALAPSGYTAIAGGVMLGLDELATPNPNPPKVVNKALVVLTDGKENRAYQSPADNQWYSLAGGLMLPPGGSTKVDTQPLSVPSDVKIYAVGIGNKENIDEGQLNVLAQSTGGYYGVVGELSGKKYFDLEKYFVQIYMDAVEKPVILDPVYTIAPGQEHKIEFDVLRGDVGALVVVLDRNGLRLPFFLVSPLGEAIDVTSVPPGFQLRSGATETARFLEFLAPPGEPKRYAGLWTVVVKHPGEICVGDPSPGKGKPGKWGFLPGQCRAYKTPVDYGIAIGVGSNFRLQPYVTPGVVHVGQPILLTAVVSEAGLPVPGCQVTVKAVSPSGAMSNLVLLDDGAHDDADSDDGEYARAFTQTAEAGSYEFTFRAKGVSRDGEPVIREAVRAKYVEGRLRLEPEHPVRASTGLSLFGLVRRVFARAGG